MPLLTAPDLHKAYGATAVLDGAELNLRRGEKIGLVGRNGTGKSTLLRILAGVEQPDAGQLAFRSDTHVAYLPQDPDLGAAQTLLDVALAGAARSRTPLEPYERHLQAEQALKHLGIPEPALPVHLASGGTKRRAALAAALLQQPDLLLLDEPTNHLDADTAQWLQEELRRLPGALVLVTHDRYFLNQVVDRIVELRKGKLYSYEGTFQDYLEARLEEEVIAGKMEANRRRALKNELDWLGRSPAARSTRPKYRLQRAEALVASQPREVERAVQLPFLQSERLGKTILEARDLKVGYPDKTVIERLEMTLVRGDRLGIVGPNGAGKSTLLRTLQGTLPPLGGTLQLGKNTHILSIDQQRSGLDPDATVVESVQPAGGEWIKMGDDKLHVASYLEQFLFRTNDFRQKVSTLSGGQRFRLLLARRLQEPMNVLLLDEPTNDLDFETLEVLEEALLQYPGCLLVVSHDRAFLDRVCTGILHVVGDGRVEVHAGNFSQFLANQAERRKVQRQADLAAERKAAPGPDRRAEAPAKLTFAEEKRLGGIEAEIEAAEAEVARCEARLQDPAVTADYPQLQAASAAHEQATRHRDELYELWQALEAKATAWAEWKRK